MFMQRGMSAYVCDELSIGFPFESSKSDTRFIGVAVRLNVDCGMVNSVLIIVMFVNKSLSSG